MTKLVEHAARGSGRSPLPHGATVPRVPVQEEDSCVMWAPPAMASLKITLKNIQRNLPGQLASLQVNRNTRAHRTRLSVPHCPLWQLATALPCMGGNSFLVHCSYFAPVASNVNLILLGAAK